MPGAGSGPASTVGGWSNVAWRGQHSGNGPLDHETPGHETRGHETRGRDTPLVTERDDRGRGRAASRDPVLIVLVALLVATLAAFALGWQPYPFGALVLALFIVARLLQLRAGRGD